MIKTKMLQNTSENGKESYPREEEKIQTILLTILFVNSTHLFFQFGIGHFNDEIMHNE